MLFHALLHLGLIFNLHAATPLGVVTSEKDWLNTSRALTEKDLKGHLVLVDFWTYCCINCMHVISELHDLEKEFGRELTVVGVHSAKYTNEKDRENIRQAILRYGIEHPVVNDANFKIWNEFGVGGWPTLVLIGLNGEIARVFSGEGNKADVADEIRKQLKKKHGKPLGLPIRLERDHAPRSVLSYPGKVIYVSDYDGQPMLFVSDSGNNRVLGVRPSGKIAMRIGEGAGLRHPQGILYRDKTLYIADTENHALKKIDLATGKDETLADKLRSPWDLAFYPDEKHIAIAMAGTHQLWSYSLETKTATPLAGTSAEGLADGKALEAKLAQPSGLSVADGKLYFVDSETSSLRVLDGDKVKTLVGTGLFDFGLKDGKATEALMQHPLGVFADGGTLYVADSYNHVVRKIADGKVSTLARGFNEPNAIVKGAKDVFYVADTNNNVIREMTSDGKVESLVVYEEVARKREATLPNAKHDIETRVTSSAKINLSLPKGWKLNDKAPSWLAIFSGEKLVREFAREELAKGVSLAKLAPGKYFLQGTFYFCKEGENALCLIQSHDLTLIVDDNAKGTEVDIRLEP